MFAKLMPKEPRFFDMFAARADEAVNISRELEAMLTVFDDLPHRTVNIETIEKRGDKITHDTIDLLHKTFITPIDRDSIHRLNTRMDDILDLSEDVAQSIVLFDVRSSTPEACPLFPATWLGIPVSTTHTITGSIIGVGTVRGVKAVRWGVAGGIVWAWVLTIPCSAFIAGVAWYVGQTFL